MADGKSGLVALHPDGTIGLTIGGTRHTLAQITVGQLQELRDAYNTAKADVEDYLDLDSTPAITALKTKVKAAKTRESRAKIREELDRLGREQDEFVQCEWAKWWRLCIATLSNKSLPDSEDPRDGLEVWMIDSPRGVEPMFAHWRSVPLEGSSGQDLVNVLTQLAG